MNDIKENIDIDIWIFANDTSLMACGSDPAEKLNRDLGKFPLGLPSGKQSFMQKNPKTSYSQRNASIILPL